MQERGERKNMQTLESKIEAILFYKNEPLDIKKLSQLLNEKEKDVREALQNFGNSLNGRGICLIETEDEVSLATAPGTKDSKEQRVIRYKGSLSLLTHLGIKRVKELPDFDLFKDKITEIKTNDGE